MISSRLCLAGASWCPSLCYHASVVGEDDVLMPTHAMWAAGSPLSKTKTNLTRRPIMRVAISDGGSHIPRALFSSVLQKSAHQLSKSDDDFHPILRSIN